MPDTPQTTAGIPDPGAHGSRNNNADGKARDQKRDEFLDIHPATARQLVQARIYKKEGKARQRIAIGVKRGMVRFAGIVNLTGHEEKLWARWHVPKGKEQHEGELTALCLAAFKAKVLRRGPHVGKYHPDAELEIPFGDDAAMHLVLLERDRSTIGIGEVLRRIMEVY